MAALVSIELTIKPLQHDVIFLWYAYLQQTPQQSWAGNEWEAELSPKPSVCSPRSGEAVVCNTRPLPNVPLLQTGGSPWCWVCLFLALHIRCLYIDRHRIFSISYTKHTWKRKYPNTKTHIPRSISVKPSAFIASAVLLSIVSKQRLASWGSSNNLAWNKRSEETMKVYLFCVHLRTTKKKDLHYYLIIYYYTTNSNT